MVIFSGAGRAQAGDSLNPIPKLKSFLIGIIFPFNRLDCGYRESARLAWFVRHCFGQQASLAPVVSPGGTRNCCTDQAAGDLSFAIGVHPNLITSKGRRIIFTGWS